MNRDEFESEVLSGTRADYVSDEAKEFFVETADFRVIDKSAMEKDQIDQTECVSVALPTSGSSVSDEDLIIRVHEALTTTSDTQKYQLRHNGGVANTIEIWRHGSGFSAFALNE